MMWAICHKSGTVLFTTSDERTMLNRKSHGWVIKMNSISNELVKDLRMAFSVWQQDYDPVEDKAQYEMFGLGVVAIDELLTLRKERERAEPDYYVVVTSAGVWQSFHRNRAEAEFIVNKPFHHGYSVLEIYTAPPAPVVGDADPSLDAMMRALDAFYADDDVPERAMLAAFKILLADVSKR